MAGEVWYLARRKLLIPNGSGSIPSSTRIAAGQRFQLDGDEPIIVNRLVSSGAIELYQESPEQDQYIEQEKQERQSSRRTRSVKTPSFPRSTKRG